MQHARKNRTLGRTKRQRTALLRGLAASLIRDGKIETTLAKAKELRPFAERLVTYAKRGSMTDKRRVAAQLGEPDAKTVRKLFDEIAPNYAERQGGYTRIIKAGRREGREQAVIEFV